MRQLNSRLSTKRAKIVLISLVLAVIPAVSIGLSKWRAAAVPCPCNLLPASPTPQGTDTNPSGLEVGFKFKSSINGYITGVRFFKMPGMSGVHTGSLWDNMGNRIATATFGSETASGWQEVSFSSPVAVTANTIYTASTFMTNGVYAYTTNYYTSDVVNYPLTAPANGTAGAADGLGQSGQGVANLSGTSAYPSNSFSSANYWVDVAFTGAPDSDPPAVASSVPTSNATGVNPGETISATFDIHMLESSIDTNTFSVKDPSNNNVAGTVSYNVATKTASFRPTAALALNTTYTATLEGGSGTVVKSLDNIALASDYAWSFTTSSTDPCPCSLKNKVNPAGSTTFNQGSARELGIKITPQANGYINAVRFYKPIISTQSSHAVTIWDSSGTSLATAVSSNESEYGWQEVKLGSPLAVNKGQLLIISYSATDGIYQGSSSALSSDITANSLTAYATGNSLNAATGSGNSNGVATTTAGAYPSTASSGDYYWIDVSFATASGVSDALAVTVSQPKNNSFGIKRSQPLTATFNHALNASTVNGSSVQLLNSSNSPVSGSVSYNANSRTVQFTPSATLGYGQQYTLKLSTAIADVDGETLGTEYTARFTTGSQLLSDPTTGPGGPVLVITSTTNKYSTYYAEILRAEGMNYFETKDISTVTAGTLTAYDAVVIAEMSLTQPQADMLGAWVTAGGNIVAMRPDKKLASLLGLTDASSTRTNQYMLVNTASAPGTGIVNESIQFKGIADNYTLSGATSVATLYSDASTSTSNPAVTTRSVGTNGGTAMAFTYDLAKSVIALHQGNQAWAGQDRDGSGSRRTNDLFFGAMTGDVQPDWVDLNKIHIPQADEQQRLLANMLTSSTKDKKPLPRFWYLPHNSKAAMILVGDDHNVANAGGTERIMNNWLNESSVGCSTLDWQCVKSTHYVYQASALTNARATQYYRLGYEIGDHISNSSACNDFTSYSNLGTIFTNDLTAWRSKYSSIPNQRTHRFHCYLWSDWDSMPRVGLDNGIRYSLEYVAYPNSWLGSRAPMVTGSGMNMRLTDADGDMLDYYQGVTNLDDTAANSTAINALLDNALSSDGYYGIFGTHYDMSNSYDQTVYNAAKARNIPMISSEEALTWLDGRGSSVFSNLTGSNGQFTFTLAAAEGTQGLKAMMPLEDAGGTLSTLKKGSDTVSYQTQTVKGVQYAVFDGAPGQYTVTYSDYTTDPGTSPGSGTPGSGNSGATGGSASTGTSQAKKNKTIFDGKQDETPAVVTNNSTPVPETPVPDNRERTERREKELIQNDGNKESSGFPWWLVSFAGVLLGGGLWWFIAARRKRHAQQLWQ